jgi:hypothetical protein
MIRFLFVLLAVVSGVLAFIFQQTFLYLVSGLLLLIAAVILFQQVRSQQRVRAGRAYPDSSFTEEVGPSARIRTGSQLKLGPDPVTHDEDQTTFAPPELRESGATDEELRMLGILEVRPKATNADEQTGDIDSEQAARDAEPQDDRPETVPNQVETDEPEDEAEEPTTVKVPHGDGAPLGTEQEATVAADVPASGDGEVAAPKQLSFFRQSAIQAHLTALKDSLEAYTVALMMADIAASKYRTVRIVSDSRRLSAIRFFPFKGHFLSRLLPEATVLRVASEELRREDLSYYSREEAIDRLMVAPVMREEQVAGFLVADFKKNSPKLTKAQKDVLAAGGLLMGSLLALRGGSLEAEPAVEAAPEATESDRPMLRLVSSGSRSPQNEVIREEMRWAREAQHPLALALVFLDDKATITSRGPSAVMEAEQWMRSRLEEIAPEGRVEHFGELGFGVFHHKDVDFVESWVSTTQGSFLTTEVAIEGSLVVGVAMLCDEHERPEDLQSDAARALRAAYETGDGTILVG